MFFKNLSLLMLNNIYVKLTSLLIMPFIAHKFTVEEFGVLAISMSMLGYALNFSDAGIKTIAVRSLSIEGKGVDSCRTINDIFSLRIIMLFFAFIFMCSFGFMFFKEPINRTIVCIIALTILPQIFDITWFYDAKQKMYITSFYKFIERTIYIIIASLGIHFLNIKLLAFSSFFSFLFAGFILWFFIKEFNIRVSFSQKQLALLKEGVGIGFSGVAVSLCLTIDQFMIKHFLGNQQLGLYCGAIKLIFVLITFAWVYSYVLFPVLSKFYNEAAHQEIKRTLKNHTLLIGIISSLFTFILCFSSEFIIKTVLSPKYLVINHLFKMLTLLLPIVCFNALYSNSLNAFYMQKRRLVIVTLALIINVLLNFFLIPKFGINGAAFSSIFSQGVVLLISYFTLKNKFKINTLLYLIFFIVLNCAIVYFSF